MLSDEELQEIQAALKHNIYKRGACVEAMKVIQKHRGWVSDEGLDDIAPVLEMTRDELDHVATFYNLIFRKPVGRHVILVCDSISCWLTGYERVREHLSNRLGVELGQTTADNKFTLLPIVCLGDCDHAPVMMVDEDLHRDLTPEKIDQILDQYE